MRPPLPTAVSSDLPRLRRRRNADLYAISLAYTAALFLCAAVVVAIMFAHGGLLHRRLDFTACMLLGFLAVSYAVIGGFLVAFTVRRLATWSRLSHHRSEHGHKAIVLFWPFAVGMLLLKAALPPPG